jgi:creatinine amidohydrolase
VTPVSATKDTPAETPQLCVCDEATFWPWLTHAAFSSMPDREGTVVVMPLCGMADWGLGHALDAEETVLMHLLRAACALAPAGRGPLVLPPLRFAFGADPACAFAVDPPAAHAFLAEVAASVAASGFRRIAIVNSSPWNEELCGAAARDLRVARGLQMFVVHLSALGLDFHPQRSRDRRVLQTLVTALGGAEPQDPGAPGAPAGWGEEPVTPLAGPALSLARARAEAPGVLAGAAARLAKLLSDIRERPAPGAGHPPP